ncbi:MAG: hypothetical protein J7K72_02050 [Candidatus Aenigmarchaeota archaeon]|nr:hypothetical protein [Candidatus Aenigmarchaeota archaeon]
MQSSIIEKEYKTVTLRDPVKRAWEIYDEEIRPVVEYLKKRIGWQSLDKAGRGKDVGIVEGFILYGLEPLRIRQRPYLERSKAIRNLKEKAEECIAIIENTDPETHPTFFEEETNLKKILLDALRHYRDALQEEIY